MKRTFVILLLFFILGSLKAQPTIDTVAVLVDSLVYTHIQNEVNEYVSSVEAEFPVKIKVFHDHDWKNKSFYETRKFINDKWKKHNIKGVVLVGYFPLMRYQVKGQGTFPMVQALGYEDIDGEFTNDGTFDGADFIKGKADPTSLKDAHGKYRAMNDTIYDHHKWADNIYYNDDQDIESKVKLELWCALIRPYQDVYNQAKYTTKAVAQLKEYLKRCSRYCRKELPYMRRGFVQSSKDWNSSVLTLSTKMKPVYGEENIVSYTSASGYNYMRERAVGLELACYYAHSSSWYHQNERVPFQTINTSDLVDSKGPGAILTFGFNCHGADYFETLTGCLGQHYMFEGKGLTFVGNTISTGNNQSSFIQKMSEGQYLGNAFLETLNEDYQDAAKRGSSVRTQQMWGNIILGNPFIWVTEDKDMSHCGAHVTGAVSNGEDVILKFKQNNNIYTVYETKNGNIDVSKLDTGNYEVEIETLNGALVASKELEITEVGQSISDWNIDISYGAGENPESYYLKLGEGIICPDDWRNDGADLTLWEKTTADAIGTHAEDYYFYDNKVLPSSEGRVLIRKHFTVHNLKENTRVYVYSANENPLLYVNGVRLVKSSDFSDRSFPSVIKSYFDITDKLLDGNNFFVALDDDLLHISDPVYEMQSEPVVSNPEEPVDFLALTTENGGLKFNWKDSSDNEDGFLLEQKMENGEFEIVSYIAKDKTELIYTNLSNNKGLTYRICAFNYAGRSSYATSLKTDIDSKKQLSEINIYPNPFNDKLIIRNVEPNSQILVRNLAGQLVHQCLASACNKQIDLRILPQGVYIISIINCAGNRVASEKVVKK